MNLAYGFVDESFYDTDTATCVDCGARGHGSDPLTPEQYKRSARLPDPVRQELLDRLDRSANSEQNAIANQRFDKRRDQRWPYRRNDIQITIEHPAGGVSQLLLCSRNLSAGGISLLHGGYIYPNSRCKLTLCRLDGQQHLATGTIVSCRHLQGLLHEIGLQFDRRIDPHDFIEAASSTGGSQERVELSDLHGHVLLADGSDLDRALVAHHLKSSGIHLMAVGTPGAAIDTIKKEVVDIVMCDLYLAGGDGITLIGKLRELGFGGPIVVMSAETDPQRIAKATQAGATHVLPKPYSHEDLIHLLVKLHRQVGAIVNRTVLYSSLDDQPGMLPLVQKYVEQARRIAYQLEKHLAEENLAEVRQACLNLKGSASGFGFAPVSGVAAGVLNVLDAHQSVRKAASQIRTLCILCRRLAVRSSRGGGDQHHQSPARNRSSDVA